MPNEEKESSEATKEPTAGAAGGDSDDEKPGSERMDRERARQELEDRQLDIAAEAKEVEKALAGLTNATDLAKERMAAAAKLADEAAEALGQGKLDDAKQPASAAKEKFDELVEQVVALVAKEQADRIAAAQQMAADLARQQDDFKDELANSGEGGGKGEPPPDRKPMPGVGNEPGDQPKGSGLAGAAQRIADKAETLNDVLAVAMKAGSPQDQPAAKKIDELVQKLALKALSERLAALPEQVREGKLEDAKTAAGDGAERMEAAAEQLGALRRSIVSPQIDELAKLEQQLAGLDERLDELDTQQRITGWHIDADVLLERLDEAGIGDDVRKEFIDEMRGQGWSPDRRVNWKWGLIEGGRYAVPVAYHRLLSRLTTSLRERMQDLMLGDMTAAGDEPIPPQYQELVDRYYRMLATQRTK